MMKKLTLICFFLSQFAFSQNIEFTLVVKDFETNLPVDEVTITAIKTKQGFLTNSEGKAVISLTKASDLELAHTSYKTYVVKFSNLNKKENVIYLESTTQLLEEIILTKEHPQEILKKIIENSQNKISVPINLKIYLREFYKKNEQIVFFNDGLLNFQILGTQKSIKTDILVEQNRAIGLLDSDIDADLLGYNLNNIIENYYQFKYLNEITTSKARKSYDFQVKTFPSNDDYLVIRVVPLEEAKGVLSEFSIVYDSNKKIIMEISSIVSPSRLQELKTSFLSSNKVFKLEFKNTFRWDNNIYYLANSKEVIGFEKTHKKEQSRIEVRNHMVVTNYDKQMFKYSNNNVFKDKSLINKKTIFFTNYWDVESGLIATAEEKTVIESLAKVDD